MNRFTVLVVSAWLAGCDGGETPVDAGNCASGPENTPAACSDGCSNDDDTAVDCDDADCAGIGDCAVVDAGHAVDAGHQSDAGTDCTTADDGTSCGVGTEICLAGACVESTCGDDFVDEAIGEACEDGNDTTGDGCEPDCRFTCTDNAGCDDVNVCTGVEVCQIDHTCSDPPDMGCDDSNGCTGDTCDPVMGCRHDRIDGDGDGFAMLGLAGCTVAGGGGDCNDGDATVYPGAFDGCGATVTDNDCDGTADEDGAGRWYADCDGDGFAIMTAQQLMQCARPGTPPTACGGGGWTMTAPDNASRVDCNDADGTVWPGAGEVRGDNLDNNCDGLVACYRDRDGDGYRTDEPIDAAGTSCARPAVGLAGTANPLEWTAEPVRDTCCDYDANMHAGQAQYFDALDDPNGNEQCATGRRWDYNCDGTQQLQYPANVGYCYSETAFACNMSGDFDTTGWYVTVQQCGGQGLYITAGMCNRINIDTCGWTNFSVQYQGCR